mgnify:CR=1 FL=1
MKKLFENWRSFLNEQDSTTPIKSPEGVVTGYEFKSGDEQQPKDDKYTQALQDIANNIKNIAAKQNFLDLAAGRQAVFQDNNPDSVRTGYKKISPGTQGLIKAAAMVYAKQVVDSGKSAKDVAEDYESKYEADRAGRAMDGPQFGDFEELSAQELFKLNFKQFSGNASVKLKGGPLRSGTAFGFPTMIKFLDSIAENPKLAARGPWYMEDISLKGGGDIDEHSSHEVGLDVDLSLPTMKETQFDSKTPESTPEKPEKVRIKTAMSIRPGYGKEKGYWNFRNIGPKNLDIPATYDFIEHCIDGSGNLDWQVSFVMIGEDLLNYFMAGLRQRTQIIGSSALKRRHPDVRRYRKMLRAVKQRKLIPDRKGGHKNHFHVRLRAIQDETENAIKKYAEVTGKKLSSYKTKIPKKFIDKYEGEAMKIRGKREPRTVPGLVGSP